MRNGRITSTKQEENLYVTISPPSLTNKAEQERNSRKSIFRPYKTRSPLNPIHPSPSRRSLRKSGKIPISGGRKAPSHQPAQKLTPNGSPPDAEKNRQTIIWKIFFSPTHYLTRNNSDISCTNKVINSIKIRPII